MAVRRFVRVVLVASLIAVGLVAASPSARADFHLMKVREIYAGSTTNPAAHFMELQMYAAGQNFVGGHTLHFYGVDIYGTPTRQDCTIPANVAVGANQAHILFATAEAQSAFPVTADFTMPASFHADAGAVCFENIDCVAWGSWSGATLHPTGNPEAAIPPDQSIDRRTDIFEDPATLQEQDDTNDSANDFAPATPSPEGNGGPNLGALSCAGSATVGGGGAGIYSLQGLTAKAKGRRAIIRGQVQPPPAGKRVRISLFANGSPMRKVARATATLNDEGRFRKRFRTPAEATRCKVRVQFEGAPLGQKRFRC